jgi:carboxymethylenebutenolidase
MLLSLSLVVMWCGRPTGDAIDADFEEEHAREMEKKEDQSSLLSWASSPTIDLLMPEVEADIVTEQVVYIDDIQWFLAYPQDDPDAPGIVMIHERRWLNDHIQDMARVLAMNGYRVLAVDLYEWVVATEFEQARELSSALDDDRATEHLLAAEAYLRSSSDRIASLWWCLWWAQSLNLSIASDTLDATVLYYGRLPDQPDRIAAINQPLLGIFASEDEWIPPADVMDFEQALDDSGMTDYTISIYDGVWHAFANPTGNNFEQEATIRAWEQTLGFLADVLE